MKIEIVCPECGFVLLDKFEAERCTVPTGTTSWLEMECISCDQLYQVELSIVGTKKEATSQSPSLVPKGFCPGCGMYPENCMCEPSTKKPGS